MKVCILGNAQSPHILRWAIFFRDRGHDVEIISARPAEVEGVVVYTPRLPFEKRLRRRRSFDEDRTPNFAVYLSYFIIGLRIRSLLRAMSPNIVMAMTMETNGIISMISGYHPTALFHLGHKALSVKAETSLVMRLLLKKMIRFSDMLYTGDSAGAQRLEELGAEPDRIYINPWGLDLDPSASVSRARTLREELGGDGAGAGARVFVSIRVLLSEYDVATFVRAMPGILASDTDAVFVIVGDGPERGRLEALARELRVESHVKFTGFVPYETLPVYLQAADYYVDPVNYHPPRGRTWWGHRMRVSMDGLGYSMTLLLALACGCIPLVTRRGGLEDIFSDRVRECLLWEPGNPDELAAKAVRAMEAEDEMDDLRATFLKLAEERFNWETNATRVEREYLEVISRFAERRDGA